MEKAPIIVVVIWSLIIQLAFAGLPASRAFAEPAMSGAGAGANASPSLETVHQAVASALADPAFSAIENDPSVSLDLNLNPHDPIVDQDPFFLRAQTWIKGAPTDASTDIESAITNTDVTLSLPGLNREWRLNLPVHPILQTDEYIFFAADAGSSLFNAVNGEDKGEGLFVIRTNELISASVRRERVPIFFFPMPGQGWQATPQADVGASEIVGHDAVVFTTTGGLPLPVSLDDVKLMLKAESVNLFLATLGALDNTFDRIEKNNSQLIQVRESLVTSLQKLSRESDAGNVGDATAVQVQTSYAALIDRINAVVGEKNLVMPRGSTAGFGLLYTGFDLDQGNDSRVFRVVATSRTQRVLHWVFDQIGISSAQAAGPLAAFGVRTAVILLKSAVIFAAGVALRYTALRKSVDAGLKNGGLKSKATVPWTIFAQSLTLLAQAPLVWPTNGLEYVMDKIGVAENSRVRKVFNSTFGYARSSNEHTPVDANSLILGVLILGGMDTTLVALQQYWVIPHLAHLLAVVFPFLASRVAEAYGAHNANIALYNLIAVLGNFVAYLTSGAYNYANNIQSIKTNDAMRTVADQLRDRGIDPNDPKNKSLYDDLVKKYVHDELARQGLPDDRTFLFDATSVYQSVQSFFGYTAPDGKDAGDFYGITRQGLMPRALEKAIKAARDSHQEDAATVLQGAQKDFSLLKTFLNSPRTFLTRSGLVDVARTYRRVRTELVSFTYKGQASDPVEISKSWGARSPTGALAAAQIFRQQYLSLIENGNSEKEKAAPSNFDPRQSEGRFARWQLKRALTRANLDFVKATGQDPAPLYSGNPDEKTASLRLQYEGFLKSELLKTVGLFPDAQETALLTDVENQTEKEFQRRLDSSKGLSVYLNSLPEFERTKVTQIYKSDIFAQTYVEATIKGERVGPLSPAQPGRFQRLRQTRFVRNSAATTRALRFAEGLFSDTRYSRGLNAKIMRDVIPMLDDQVSGNMRALRLLPVTAIFAYLWNGMLWHVVLPFKDFMINYTFRGSTISGPWATTQRINDKEGWKAGQSKLSMAKYAFIGSWATFTGGMFYALFHNDMENAINAVGAACQVILKAIGL